MRYIILLSILFLFSCSNSGTQEERDNPYFVERTLSFYDPHKPFWNGKDKEAYEHLRKPENLKMLHETFKKIGYQNLISDYSRFANPCMIWSYINKPCNELADSLILTYELDTVESKYYREFWERRNVEGNSQTVYEILKEINSELYEDHMIAADEQLVNDTLFQLLKITHLGDSLNSNIATKRFNYLKQIGLHSSAFNLLFERYRYFDHLRTDRDELVTQLNQDTTNCCPWPWVEDDTK
ncbi:MAG: hypothetical protein ABJH98_03395 [Reichenbachiella sp.]|uniref:hypothetical protein n=1 Tax=Reichenbachiella sp. TaxID=2184521 RepID=UPI00329A2194